MFLAGRLEEFCIVDLLSLLCGRCTGTMEARTNVVSSSSATVQNSDKQKLNCDKWNDDLLSNVNYTKPWYRAEITKLKAEISKLESNLKDDQQSFSTVHFNDILAKLLNKLSKDKQTLLEGLDMKGKLNEDGEIDIKRLERFTGLCIRNIALRVEKEAEDVCVRRHQIHGSCRGIEFQTTFLVEENTSQDARHEGLQDKQDACGTGNLPQIIALDVSVENEAVSLNMRDFLQYVEEEKQLQQFFRTLMNYSKWKRDRLKTFNHFQEEFPDLVTHTPLRDETVLTICNQQYANVRVNIVWKLLVTRKGEVKPSFDLQSCIPTEHIPDKGFLKKMRSKFLVLLQNLGIEKSIEVITLTIAK